MFNGLGRMRYFKIDPLGDEHQTEFCFADTGPKGGIDAYDLSTGGRIADQYPAGFGDVLLKLSEDSPGLELPSFIGNTNSLLIVSHQAASVILSREVGEIELIPFKLVNHKGRIHSIDYRFLNLIGSVDCLDVESSECIRFTDGTVMKYTRFVLSAAKVVSVPHLFRIRESPVDYVFSEDLVEALRSAHCTNFVVEELETTG